MKAAIVTGAGKNPVYGDFNEPAAADGMEIVTVKASALSNLTKSRASGSHYSSDNVFPAVAGVDGVGCTSDGRRVYFAMPEAPYGALAEKCLVRAAQCIPVPDGLDDVVAAAIANPGMSGWAALVERAHVQQGETVLVHGATGTAGRLAVQLAKHLGAAKVVATGRNESELQQLSSIGADVVIPFNLGVLHPMGGKKFEQALGAQFSEGVDIVIDYLWGESAKTIIVAIAKKPEDGRAVRFVQVGSAAREENIDLPAAALRSSPIQLMGSGVKSVPFPKLLDAIKNVFEIAGPAKLQIALTTQPLSAIEQIWKDAPGRPRVVFTM